MKKKNFVNIFLLSILAIVFLFVAVAAVALFSKREGIALGQGSEIVSELFLLDLLGRLNSYLVEAKNAYSLRFSSTGLLEIWNPVTNSKIIDLTEEFGPQKGCFIKNNLSSLNQQLMRDPQCLKTIQSSVQQYPNIPLIHPLTNILKTPNSPGQLINTPYDSLMKRFLQLENDLTEVYKKFGSTVNPATGFLWPENFPSTDVEGIRKYGPTAWEVFKGQREGKINALAALHDKYKSFFKRLRGLGIESALGALHIAKPGNDVFFYNKLLASYKLDPFSLPLNTITLFIREPDLALGFYTAIFQQHKVYAFLGGEIASGNLSRISILRSGLDKLRRKEIKLLTIEERRWLDPLLSVNERLADAVNRLKKAGLSDESIGRWYALESRSQYEYILKYKKKYRSDAFTPFLDLGWHEVNIGSIEALPQNHSLRKTIGEITPKQLQEIKANINRSRGQSTRSLRELLRIRGGTVLGICAIIGLNILAEQAIEASQFQAPPSTEGEGLPELKPKYKPEQLPRIE